MLTLILLVAFTALAFGLVAAGFTRVAGWRRLALGRTRLPDEDATQVAAHVGVRVSLHGPMQWHSMKAGKLYRTEGELRQGPGRVVLATSKGLLLDLSTGGRKALKSVRATGPGRLVVEGELPRPTGAPGLFRLELSVDPTGPWVDAFGAHVVEGGDVVHGPGARPAASAR